MEDNKQYKCECCGKFITEDEGTTTLEGLWVCDTDKCRTLDDNNDSTINRTFNMDIMNDAEKLVQSKCTFDTLDSFLFREGYELLHDRLSISEVCIEGEEIFELSNGWVVVGLM